MEKSAIKKEFFSNTIYKKKKKWIIDVDNKLKIMSMVHVNNTSQRDTSIYIALDLQLLLHMVSEWVSVPLSQKNPEEKCV